ncbi:Hypothetical predicted protein [Cloeon dipterum]|uniref:Uncharacterized protein n=1 Tax=Cloeon dipterum TaxID=197152 RepID=A0A8S1DE66_9INSE|nr:Hypothetical predicted protein [Cloeon dipterum]
MENKDCCQQDPLKKMLDDMRRRWNLEDLENLALHYVGDNFDLFSEQNQFAMLPIQLRENVLQRVLLFRCLGYNSNPEMFPELLKALPQLLSPRTRRVNLDGFLSFCSKDKAAAVIQVFGWIVRLAPNVEELSLRRFGIRVLPVGSLLQPLSQMKKLRKMQLKACSFRFCDLSKLCGDLPSLQVVSVGALQHLERDLGDGSEHERNLQNLRVLEKIRWRRRHRTLLATVAPHLDCIAACY